MLDKSGINVSINGNTNSKSGVNDTYTISFSINYQTNPGENLFILGSIPHLGSWKTHCFRLKWSTGHQWKGDLMLRSDILNFSYKFVCVSEVSRRWEEGPNRTFKKNSLSNDYKLSLMWSHFSVSFNIFYPLDNPSESLQIIGSAPGLGEWFKNGGAPVKMKLTESKTIEGITGKFWTTKVYLNAGTPQNFKIDYRYSIYNKYKVWEREPNRILNILSDPEVAEKDEYTSELLTKVGRDVELITNSHIERLDVNFVSDLKFHRIGEYKIFIGPYPQNEQDIETLNKSGVTSVLNVQTDSDMQHRQVNWKANLSAYNKFGIKVVRFPIRDFDSQDLISKLKTACDKLKALVEDDDDVVYVHCTAGMSRAAATVIGYLVLYQDFALDNAYEYVKSYRSVICPNISAIKNVIEENENI